MGKQNSRGPPPEICMKELSTLFSSCCLASTTVLPCSGWHSKSKDEQSIARFQGAWTTSRAHPRTPETAPAPPVVLLPWNFHWRLFTCINIVPSVYIYIFGSLFPVIEFTTTMSCTILASNLVPLEKYYFPKTFSILDSNVAFPMKALKFLINPGIVQHLENCSITGK